MPAFEDIWLQTNEELKTALACSTTQGDKNQETRRDEMSTFGHSQEMRLGIHLECQHLEANKHRSPVTDTVTE